MLVGRQIGETVPKVAVKKEGAWEKLIFRMEKKQLFGEKWPWWKWSQKLGSLEMEASRGYKTWVGEGGLT